MPLKPSESQRQASRIDAPWRPDRYVTFAGGAVPTKHMPKYRDAAHYTTAALFKAMMNAPESRNGR